DDDATIRYSGGPPVSPAAERILRASSSSCSATRWRSVTHSASTRAGLIAAGAGWTTATSGGTPRTRLNHHASASASSPDALPSNPTTTGPDRSIMGLVPVQQVDVLAGEQAVLAVRPAQPRVAVAVQAVDEHADGEPHDEPDPRGERQVLHQVDGERDAEQREDRRERRPVRPRHVRAGPAQDDDADVDQ